MRQDWTSHNNVDFVLKLKQVVCQQSHRVGYLLNTTTQNTSHHSTQTGQQNSVLFANDVINRSDSDKQVGYIDTKFPCTFQYYMVLN